MRASLTLIVLVYSRELHVEVLSQNHNETLLHAPNTNTIMLKVDA